MLTTVELLDAYEIANRIVHESAIYYEHEHGEFALVSRARELTQAEKAWDDLRKMPVNDLGSPERAKAFAASDAFAEAYDSYRTRRVEKATSQAS